MPTPVKRSHQLLLTDDWTEDNVVKVHKLAVSAVASMLVAGAAFAATPAAPPAKLSMAQARAIAVKLAPGKITKQEYEKEGKGWRYSFDIMQGKRIHEIGVDANSGRIVENVFEKPGAKG